MINKVTLVGRVGYPPDMRYTENNLAWCLFTVATWWNWVDKETGERKELTEWHNMTAWDEIAEFCNRNIKKGQLVYIEGRLKTSSWESDGEKKKSTRIVVTEIRMLGAVEKKKKSKSDPPQYKQKQFSPVDDDIPF